MKANLQAEQFLIASVILSPQTDAALEAIEKVKPCHFSERAHQDIWQSLGEMMNSGRYIDEGTLDAWMFDQLNANYRAVIMAAMTACPSAAGLKSYTKSVYELGELRIAEAHLMAAINAINSNGAAIDRVNRALTEVAKIGQTDSDDGFVDPFDAIIQLNDRMEAALAAGNSIAGLSSGFIGIDRLTNGFFGGQLIIVAARPGVGKTSLTMNMAESMALFNQKSKNVLYVSLEMPAVQLIAKTSSNYQSIHLSDIVKGYVLDPANIEGISRFGNVVEMVKRKRKYLLIDEKSGQHITQLQARAKRAKIKMGGLDCIFVDYLGLVNADGENQVVRVARVSAGLKQLAKELNVPIIALCQFNRAITGEPTMANLRDSGNIEQDADIVILLHDEDHGKERTENSLTKCIIAKNRMGQTGHCYLEPHLKYSRFIDTDREPVKEQPKLTETPKRFSIKGAENA